ncbi:MAG: MATE family efflux transporter [Clostridia bacterium]
MSSTTNKKTKDLTTGKPYKVIIAFAVPILIGNLLQQVYNITDSAIVGQFIGIEALAGVGSTGSLNFLIIGFVIGTCSGFGIPIAQSYGAKNYDNLRRYFTHAIYLGGTISIILTVFTLLFVDEILVLMNTTEEMMPYAKTYISTIFAGITGMFLYNLLSSVLRSVGDSKTPLYFLIGSAFSNVALDLLFVLVFNMGVFGTSLATVLSQTVSGIMCIILINKKFDILKTVKKDWEFSMTHAKKMLYLGLPMGLQFSITAIGSVILQSSVNSLGTIAAASISAGSRINAFTMKALETLGLAMATFTGQNLGAGKFDRVTKGLIQTMLIGFGYSVVMFVVLFFTSDYLALILVSPEETEAIANIKLFLLVNSAAYLINTLLHVFRNTIQGAGYSAVAMIAGVLEMCARIFVAYVLVGSFAYMGAILANPIAWSAAVVFLIPTYIVIIKRLKRMAANGELQKNYN